MHMRVRIVNQVLEQVLGGGRYMQKGIGPDGKLHKRDKVSSFS